MSWDTIIVGGGTAGGCLAARLSEDPSRSVLLLEAGPDHGPSGRPEAMKSLNPYLILMPEDYKATYMWPDLMAMRTGHQVAKPYWSGRGVGGSSSINGEIAIRGVLEAFDEWERLGCAGWSGKDVLPDFIRLESDLLYGDRDYHGSDGPIPIYRTPQERWGPVDTALRDAALSLGHPWCDDLNAPDAIGVVPFAINARDGHRVSVAESYVDPARGRPNLTIMADVLVDRVLFDGDVATGVKVITASGPVEYSAGEIVLCTSTVRSPGILIRSGVGPRQVLEGLGVPVVADLPGVGAHVMDHPAVRLKLKLRKDLEITDIDARHTNCAVKFSSGLEGGSFSDMILVAMNHGGVIAGDDSPWAAPATHVMLYDAHSRGRIVFTSTDPMADPEIHMNMLSDRRDLDRLRRGARHLFEIGQTSFYQAMCDRITCGDTDIPLEQMANGSDADIDAWMLSDCGEGLHLTGTCRMGADDDPGSVVDSSCRVLKTKQLKIVDASIMPADCRANTHLTTIMMAEHFARRSMASS